MNNNADAINIEHRNMLVELFHKIRIDGYTHDPNKSYQIFTSILKRKPIKENYDIETFKKVLEYFVEYGLTITLNDKKQTPEKAIYAFLQHAFRYPDVAMKPYNTIDLRDSNNNRVKEKDDSKKIIQPVSRNEYKKEFQKIGDKLLKEMEEHAKSGKPIDTGYHDEDYMESSGGIGCDKCISGYIEVGNGVWDFCECYKRERFKVKMRNAGIPEEYFNIDNIEINQGTIITRKMFGENNEMQKGININIMLNNYKNNIHKIKEEGWNLLFEGPTGSGKTTAACICAKHALKNNYSVLFVEVQNLRKIWTGESLTEQLNAIKQKMYEVDFLILDDLGQEFISLTSEHQITEMDLLFRKRIAEKKNTIITTNSSQEKIKERYKERIYSLLQKRTIHIKIFTEQDFRSKEKAPDFLFE